MKVKEFVSSLQDYSTDLGIDLSEPEGRFKWLLASMLFANRISSKIAERTYKKFEEEGLTTPERILDAGWDRLVQVLDSGGYTRYDFSTATYLLDSMKKLREEYGDLERVHELSEDPEDLERRIEEFKGIGPVGVNIFLRELRDVWAKSKPAPSDMAVDLAEALGIDEVERYESKLVRLNLEYCKKGRCDVCPVEEYCRDDPVK